MKACLLLYPTNHLPPKEFIPELSFNVPIDSGCTTDHLYAFAAAVLCGIAVCSKE